MSRWAAIRASIAHAFATEPPPLTAAEEATVDRIAASVRERGLETAAFVALEAARPLAGVAGHGIDFASPLLRPVAEALGIDLPAAAQLIRNRHATDRLTARLTDDPA